MRGQMFFADRMKVQCNPLVFILFKEDIYQKNISNVRNNVISSLLFITCPSAVMDIA
jgi:hypothetical protein